MASNLFSRGFTGYSGVPNFYSGYKAPSANNKQQHTRPNSAGATRRPTGSGYASNNPTTTFFPDKPRDEPRYQRQGSSSGGAGSGSGGSSSRPSSAGAHRRTNEKKEQPSAAAAVHGQAVPSPVPVSPPGYARPKSASMGRSKSQGLSSKYPNEDPHGGGGGGDPSAALYQKPIPAPVLSGRQSAAPYGSATTSGDRWTSSYRLQYGLGAGTNGEGSGSGTPATSARPYSGGGSANSQYYQRGASTGKEVVLDENLAFQGINLSGSGAAADAHGANGNTASSRIRAAINLGNQYNQQLKQKTQVVEDAVAVAKERVETAALSSAQQNQQQRPTSAAGGPGTGPPGAGYAEMRPRMIKTIHNSTPAPTAAPSIGAGNRGNTTERTETDGEGADIDDHERGGAGGAELDDEDDDILGEGRDMEGGAGGGLGTDEGVHRYQTDSRSYGHTTNPEVSTPSLSIELGQQSSLSAHLHHQQNSIDIRNGSSSLEEINPSEYHFKLTTLPNQFCSMKEAVELQKIILSSRYEKSGSTGVSGNGPAAAALMDMYMVGKIVGVGSYGKVRAAWHRLTSSKVAIKTYDKSKLKDPEHWKRVQSEIKIMEQISHPRIARLYEAVETPKRMHLIMECLDGGNLCSYVKSKKRLSEDESKRIFFQLVQSVDYLHQHCIIHRDIKLENVLFDKNKDIKLIDFGFSTVSPDGKKLKVFCGTPSYMAPEIVRRTEYEGKPVDIWGLGILLYALLCGCFPFRAKTYPDLYRRIARGSFTIPDELSSPVRDLLRQLLTVDAYTRVTSTAILRHPWLHSQHSTAPDMNRLLTETAILISHHPIDDINDGIITELVEFGVSKDEVVRQVMSKTHSSLSTLYYLLLHTLKGDGHRHTGKSGAIASSSVTGGGGGTGAGAGGHHVLSSGADVTRKYSNDRNYVSATGGGGGASGTAATAEDNKPQFRPHSASANRPIPQPVLSSQPVQAPTQQRAGAGHRPRSASAGRSARHYQ